MAWAALQQGDSPCTLDTEPCPCGADCRFQAHVSSDLVVFYHEVIKSGKAWDDATVSPVIRQTLLHWAYELNAADWEAWRDTH